MKPLLHRVLPRVCIGDSPTGCWEWTGFVDKAGYGRARLGGRSEPVGYVHRIMYELEYGPIPEGLVIDHLCRNRICCNPAHLEAVTSRVNALRGHAPTVLIHQTGRCARGHDASEAYRRRSNGRVVEGSVMTTSITSEEYRETLARGMPEAVLLERVRGIAHVHGWLTYHCHRSDRSEPGFPDLVLVHARAQRIVFAELKRQNGHLTNHQEAWMGGLRAVARSFFDLAGQAGQSQTELRFGVYIWRPSDLLDGSIEEALRP